MRRVKQRVPMEECRRRAFAALSPMWPKAAAAVADAIWPDQPFRTRQGAGAAASRVLTIMAKDGCARWISNGQTWGWIRS